MTSILASHLVFRRFPASLRRLARSSSSVGAAGFEWFLPAEHAVAVLAPALPAPGAHVLHIGAGTSRLGKLLSSRGYSVTNVDNDADVVALSRGEIGGTWEVADVRELPPKWTDNFDAVVDKGCIDALLKWGSADDPLRCLESASRVLTCKGHMIFITDDPPERRGELLEQVLGRHGYHIAWRELEEEEVGSASWIYYLYVCAGPSATGPPKLW
eukprot:gnl/TRDRNA2_/TRDRNA2_87822_c1_seq1.p1 gnl/TRDRNA2_/TRDRNA2_87822_c1~~gnl/TRDRNA2_/TRDRNA2_87822_c1_seq1.p1  ORF type:complete len:214 (-),score=31.84 gnl/TRDRNA2_/TRDRNA2_87822_c1_seq1:101-742(-)